MAQWKKGQSGNPKGRPSKADAMQKRIDGWQNVLTGIGTISHDKRLQGAALRTDFCTDVVDWDEALDIWRGDDLGARIVESVPSEMVREGWTISVAEDPELQEALTHKLEALDSASLLWTALAYERAYGGAAIYLGANDGTEDLRLPLDLDRVRTFDWMTVFEPREVTPITWYTDPRHPKFGKPEIYQLNPFSPGGVISGESSLGAAHNIHESRFLIFPGVRVSRRNVGTASGWGDSIFTRCKSVLRDFNMSWSAAAILIHDFSQAIFKMQGLAELIGQDGGGDVVKKRMQAVELSRSVARAILIDAEEDFERKQTPLTGLPEILDRFSTRLAAAADMPLTLLMGQSPAGLNATGESDIRFFYDRVAAMQDRRLRPALERLVEICLAVQGQSDALWSIDFISLWQPTEKERAETRFIQAQTDQIYLNTGVLSADEVAESRFSGDSFCFETIVDFDERAKLEIGEETQTPIQPSSPNEQSPDSSANEGNNSSNGSEPTRGN